MGRYYKSSRRVRYDELVHGVKYARFNAGSYLWCNALRLSTFGGSKIVADYVDTSDSVTCVACLANEPTALYRLTKDPS